MVQDQIRRIALPLVFAATSGVTLLGSIVAAPAHAEERSWCLVQDDITRCDYISFQQCRRTGLGLGASCTENPRLVVRSPSRAAHAESR